MLAVSSHRRYDRKNEIGLSNAAPSAWMNKPDSQTNELEESRTRSEGFICDPRSGAGRASAKNWRGMASRDIAGLAYVVGEFSLGSALKAEPHGDLTQ